MVLQMVGMLQDERQEPTPPERGYSCTFSDTDSSITTGHHELGIIMEYFQMALRPSSTIGHVKVSTMASYRCLCWAYHVLKHASIVGPLKISMEDSRYVCPGHSYFLGSVGTGSTGTAAEVSGLT